MKSEIRNRKGPRKAQDIPIEVLGLLNRGEIPTVNLTEWLAVDHIALIHHTFPQMGIASSITERVVEQVAAQKKPSAMNTTKLVGALLQESLRDHPDFEIFFDKISVHTSDSIRCYAPYLISLNTDLSLEEKFKKALPLVADVHFGIREVVWMALRPEIDKHLDDSIAFLSTWTDNEDENIRRFTTEATRPRGVWCKHIDALKKHPEKALPILEKLKSDGAKYVQDSVGNWLNDASKTQPDFVIELCDRWAQESPTKETARIIKRARRSIDKK